MNEPIYLTDAYARDSAAKVIAITDEGGIVLDRTVFYPTGGGQPGDSGWLNWDKQRMPIATTVKGLDGSIILVPAEPEEIPQPGTDGNNQIRFSRQSVGSCSPGHANRADVLVVIPR